MAIQHVSSDTLALLGRYDTPTICNVIELFDVRPRDQGFMDSRIRACFPEMPPIVGFASTATIRTAFPKAEGAVYSSLDDQARALQSLPGPAIVVFQDLDDPAVAATFGEIMCSTYQAFGAKGIITSGAARDLDQVRRLGFAAFSNGVISAHGYSHIVDIHAPVRVGGLLVRPGDLLHADCNGVTNIPVDIASDAAAAAEEYVVAESIVLDFLKSGVRDVARYSEARRASLAAITELGRRVRARSASA